MDWVTEMTPHRSHSERFFYRARRTHNVAVSHLMQRVKFNAETSRTRTGRSIWRALICIRFKRTNFVRLSRCRKPCAKGKRQISQSTNDKRRTTIQFLFVLFILLNHLHHNVCVCVFACVRRLCAYNLWQKFYRRAFKISENMFCSPDQRARDQCFFVLGEHLTRSSNRFNFLPWNWFQVHSKWIRFSIWLAKIYHSQCAACQLALDESEIN